DWRGRGSEFVVMIQAIEADSASLRSFDAGGVTPQPRPAERPVRVLVVDDNEDAAEMLRDWLIASGHEASAVHDGASALDAAARVAPEVVLLDLGLPVMDGFEVARRLRAQATFDATTIVAVTGYGQSPDKARSADAGFDAHLVKPVDLDVLERLIDRARCGRCRAQ
ncbi:MAG: response regulator, partial [Polyangiaceae bacterium]